MFVVQQHVFKYHLCEITLLGVQSKTLESWKSFIRYQTLGILVSLNACVFMSQSQNLFQLQSQISNETRN